VSSVTSPRAPARVERDTSSGVLRERRPRKIPP
jgi:hypothetical protein